MRHCLTPDLEGNAVKHIIERITVRRDPYIAVTAFKELLLLLCSIAVEKAVQIGNAHCLCTFFGGSTVKDPVDQRDRITQRHGDIGKARAEMGCVEQRIG